MRLSLAVPTVAGLLLAWAVAAQADAPPAAPIFYCPTPAKAAAPAPAKTPGPPAQVQLYHTHGHHGLGCPTVRYAERRHWRRAEMHLAAAAPPTQPAPPPHPAPPAQPSAPPPIAQRGPTPLPPARPAPRYAAGD